MDHQENYRKNKQQVNERSSHMEDEECSDPCEKQDEREGKKNEPHEQSPS